MMDVRSLHAEVLSVSPACAKPGLPKPRMADMRYGEGRARRRDSEIDLLIILEFYIRRKGM